MRSGLRVLITNVELHRRTGTETSVRDLALGLRNRGHVPQVYSPRLGAIADEIAAAGIRVTDCIDRLSERPDVIHGHHHAETMVAIQKFQDVPAIFVCHSRLWWFDSPPLIDRIRRYVAVDENCRERLLEEGAPPERIRLVLNWVDTTRFQSRAELPAKPQRALVFSNSAAEQNYLPAVRDACRSVGIHLEVAGEGIERPASSPETLLRDYDLVFAKAKCALEAMAAGCAVVLCDASGLGPLVTHSNVRDLLPWNFGMRLLTQPLESGAIAAAIACYDPADAAAVTRYIREHGALTRALPEYEAVYEEALAEPPPGNWCTAFHQYATSIVSRTDAVLHQLWTVRSLCHMDALLPAAWEGVALTLLQCPESALAGSTFNTEVAVHNRSSARLASSPPYPVNLSYHWLDARGARTVQHDGLRTALPIPLDPKYSAELPVRIAAPDRPGQYLLRVTLVQEGVRWFDSAEPAVFADRLVRVHESL